jgi:SAM-dependent methyltransferase
MNEPTNPDPRLPELVRDYDKKYGSGTHFEYRDWLYQPFIDAIIAHAGLKAGDRVLDLGCGQGYFSGLFSGRGMRTTGVDLSGEAIRQATARYGSTGASFEIGDVCQLGFAEEMDGIFVRGCSLYNSVEFCRSPAITDRFLQYLKPGGILVFDYYTNLSRRKQSAVWRHHTLGETKAHFARHRDAQVYFTLRMDTRILGRHAFSRVNTVICSAVSRVTGLGGDLVVFLRKS